MVMTKECMHLELEQDFKLKHLSNITKEQTVELTEGEERVYQATQELIQSLLEENKKLRKANSNLKNESRRKGKRIGELKDQLKKLQPRKKVANKYYRNGKRGTKYNG